MTRHLTINAALKTLIKSYQKHEAKLANPSVLAWRIPGTGEPGGLQSMGSHRVRHD